MKLSAAIEQYGQSLNQQDRQRFYALADEAIKAGQLTEAERDVICRPGTRKRNYWRRHLRDLRDVLAERRERQVSA